MDDELARAFGERARFARQRTHQTQAVVAGLSGITTDYLYQIERGKKLPALPRRDAACQGATGVAGDSPQ